MSKAAVYIHGKGGSAAEAEHYKSLFADLTVIGFDYKSQTPWEAESEFAAYFGELHGKYEDITVIANSIGAYFAMNALNGSDISKAYFISPVVDMKKLIEGMMNAAGVTADELREKSFIETPFGETLSWDYLCYAENHQPKWNVPTYILYGEKDELTSYETISAFSENTGTALTVMPEGEHWFHTDEQMAFLDGWIKSEISADADMK